MPSKVSIGDVLFDFAAPTEVSLRNRIIGMDIPYNTLLAAKARRAEEES